MSEQKKKGTYGGLIKLRVCVDMEYDVEKAEIAGSRFMEVCIPEAWVNLEEGGVTLSYVRGWGMKEENQTDVFIPENLLDGEIEKFEGIFEDEVRVAEVKGKNGKGNEGIGKFWWRAKNTQRPEGSSYGEVFFEKALQGLRGEIAKVQLKWERLFDEKKHTERRENPQLPFTDAKETEEVVDPPAEDKLILPEPEEADSFDPRWLDVWRKGNFKASPLLVPEQRCLNVWYHTGIKEKKRHQGRWILGKVFCHALLRPWHLLPQEAGNDQGVFMRGLVNALVRACTENCVKGENISTSSSWKGLKGVKFKIIRTWLGLEIDDFKGDVDLEDENGPRKNVFSIPQVLAKKNVEWLKGYMGAFLEERKEMTVGDWIESQGGLRKWLRSMEVRGSGQGLFRMALEVTRGSKLSVEKGVIATFGMDFKSYLEGKGKLGGRVLDEQFLRKWCMDQADDVMLERIFNSVTSIRKNEENRFEKVLREGISSAYEFFKDTKKKYEEADEKGKEKILKRLDKEIREAESFVRIKVKCCTEKGAHLKIPEGGVEDNKEHEEQQGRKVGD